MRVVDEAEVRLDAVEHVGVRPEQGPVGLEHRLEGGLPPGELELGGDVRVRHVAVRQVGDERLELQVAEGLHELGALLQVVQDVGLLGEPRDRRDELVDRQVRQLGLTGGAAERLVESSRSSTTFEKSTWTSAMPVGTSGLTPAAT